MSFTSRRLTDVVDRLRGRSLRRHIIAALLGMSSLGVACRGGDHTDREALLERADATRLVGAWDVTLVMERPLTPLHEAHAIPAPVTGTAAFTANRRSELNFDDFGIVTHKGVFDLDLTSFSLPVGDDARSQSAVARTIPAHSQQANARTPASRDSVIIALIPADSRLSIRMSGVLAGDSVSGSWIAEFLRNQASGRFTMRRHLTP